MPPRCNLLLVICICISCYRTLPDVSILLHCLCFCLCCSIASVAVSFSIHYSYLLSAFFRVCSFYRLIIASCVDNSIYLSFSTKQSPSIFVTRICSDLSGVVSWLTNAKYMLINKYIPNGDMNYTFQSLTWISVAALPLLTRLHRHRSTLSIFKHCFCWVVFLLHRQAHDMSLD